MMKCEEATRLASDGLDRRLSVGESLSLRFHLLSCGACSNFKRQIKAMNRISRRYVANSDTNAGDK